MYDENAHSQQQAAMFATLKLFSKLLEAILDTAAPFRVSLVEQSDLALDDLWVLDLAHVRNKVLDQIILFFAFHQPVQVARLHKVVVGLVEWVTTRLAVQLHLGELCTEILQLLLRAIGVLALRLVVRRAVKVLRVGHWAIALMIAHLYAVGLVDGDLQVIGAETMAVCIRVREETALQHLVIRNIDTGDNMRG